MSLATVVSSLALAASLVPVAQASVYSLSTSWVGSGFYNGFTAQAIPDPTNGRVNYVSQAQAQSLNLTYASDSTFILRTDDTTVLNPSGAGRNSVRLQSNALYSTSLLVANIRHMPEGCATWPALWSYGTNWPYDGEIDIIEGVNGYGTNAATLHTSPGCSMPASRAETGTVNALDCDTAVNGNAGCGVSSTSALSYGPSFNNNGGGWYAMERTSTAISVWFWPRNAANLPAAIGNNVAGSADTSTFGEPMAYFPNTDCDIGSHFGAHHIIINLTLCGDWAGQQAIYAGDGCPSTCIDYVNNNPAAFANAYWNFAALSVYQ